MKLDSSWIDMELFLGFRVGKEVIKMIEVTRMSGLATCKKLTPGETTASVLESLPFITLNITISLSPSHFIYTLWSPIQLIHLYLVGEGGFSFRPSMRRFPPTHINRVSILIVCSISLLDG